ncbi:MAG: hypothetical protein HY000_36980 [Planctomycetes bacterium]|nr:hypothetical protein [Planctomycetota bacterium]
MSSYIGIDYGSAMIKAAVTTSTDARPARIMLGGRDACLPAAVELVEGNRLRAGWPAFRDRIRRERFVAYRFRDVAVDAGSHVELGDRSINAVELHTALLTALGQRITSTLAPQLTALAIPDDWREEHYALPRALGAASFLRPVLVRESVAAIAAVEQIVGQASGLPGVNTAGQRPTPRSGSLVLLSLSGDRVRARRVELTGRQWQVVAEEVIPCVGIPALSKKLQEMAATEIAQTVHAVANWDPEAMQSVADSVEQALCALSRRAAVHLQIRAFDRDFDFEWTRKQIVEVAANREPIVALVRRVLGNAPEDQRGSMVAWGAMAALLPLAEWFAELRLPIEVLPHDALASGAARIAAAMGEGLVCAADCAAFGTQTGDYYAMWDEPLDGRDAVPVIERVPAGLASLPTCSDGNQRPAAIIPSYDLASVPAAASGPAPASTRSKLHPLPIALSAASLAIAIAIGGWLCYRATLPPSATLHELSQIDHGLRAELPRSLAPLATRDELAQQVRLSKDETLVALPDTDFGKSIAQRLNTLDGKADEALRAVNTRTSIFKTENANGTLVKLWSCKQGGGAASVFDSKGNEAIGLDAFDNSNKLTITKPGTSDTAIIIASDEDDWLQMYSKKTKALVWISLEKGANPRIKLTNSQGKSSVFQPGGDIAESLPLAAGEKAEPGDLVSLAGSEEGAVQIRRSQTAYDPRVLGVVSGAGGIRPALVMHSQEAQDECAVALLGLVYCKAEAENAAIAAGDLVVASDVCGHVRKGDPAALRPGVIVGKALGSLSSGRGLIAVWLGPT